MSTNKLVIERASSSCDTKKSQIIIYEMDSCAIATTAISAATAFRHAHTIINLIFSPPKSNLSALHTDWLLPRNNYFLNMPSHSFLNLCLSSTGYLRNKGCYIYIL